MVPAVSGLASREFLDRWLESHKFPRTSERDSFAFVGQFLLVSASREGSKCCTACFPAVRIRVWPTELYTRSSVVMLTP